MITSNNFSSKSFDDSNKMNKISNNMNLTSITIDYNNFNYYPMTTSNATTLIKPSDDNEMKNELNTDEDDVIDYSENDDPKMTSMNFSKMSTAGAKKPNRPSIVDYSSDNDKEFKRQLFVQDDDQIANAAGDLTSTCLKVFTFLYSIFSF